MLENVHFDEARQSQLPAIELLLAMDYKYISIEESLRQRSNDTTNFILKDIAMEKLMEINGYEVDGKEYKFSEKDVRDAILELEHIQYEGLIDTAQKIFNIVMPTAGGKTIKVAVGKKTVSKNFRFIDFKNPQNNSFHVTVEYVATGKQNIRPDIVCFINGLPFAIIENKKSSVTIVEALNQMNRNQGAEYCPRLFTYTQLLVATNGKEIQYGTTGTPNKFYAVWKEKETTQEEIDKRVKNLVSKKIEQSIYADILKDLNGETQGHIQVIDRLITEQDRGIAMLFEPTRLLDLTKNYTLFDAGEKKLSRYQQYFAIHKSLNRISEIETTDKGIIRRRGGLVWHTQGSGKSLTMVMFVKALIEDPHISNPRVIIVTDRKDLDGQIKDTFRNCNLKKEVIQATTGEHLLGLIEEKNLAVITTLVQKFETAREKKAGFVDHDQNIFVLVDEAHRTQGGLANQEMTSIIPNACYIGFTGTPLMKAQKESWRKFGDYIDKYTIDDALEDKIILPLIYEGRYVDLVQNEEQIDRHIDYIAKDVSGGEYIALDAPRKKQLQKHISTDILRSNPQRIEEIARDIEQHFMQHFQNTGLKAQIVAPSKYAAVLFQKFFQNRQTIRTALIVSDEHDDGDLDDLHKKEVVEYLDSVRKNHSSITKYEQEIVRSFKKDDDGIETIIVVDKLLTGFDAPRNTVLYLAKDLRDHNLLQAIARVNRLYENKKLQKTAGYIIDYSENAKNIDTAMKLFGNYDAEDVKSTLIDVKEKINELEESYSQIQNLFKELQGSTDYEAYLQLLGDEAKRELFYKGLNNFVRQISECFVLQDFVHEFRHFDMYKRDLKKFMELRKAVNLRYAETTDLAGYKQALIGILDRYVDAKGVELLTRQINITDRKQFEEAVAALGSDKSKAEAIAAQIQKTTTEKMDSDPEFYDRFSKKITEILEQMREGKLADIAALKQIKLLEDDILSKRDKELPEGIESLKGADIFYRNLREKFIPHSITEEVYTTIVIDITTILKKEAIVDWYKNIDVKRRMMNVIDDYLYDVVKKQKNIQLSDEESKSLISNILFLAENNHEILS